MNELLTVLTRKGQITVPAAIRKALHLKQGDKIALSISQSGKPEVTLRPVRSVAEMTFGSVRTRKRPEDLDQLRRMFEEGVAMQVTEETKVSRRSDNDRSIP